MLWTKGIPITKLCQKAWHIRIRPWKRKHGSVQRRLTGVWLEKTSQSLSFSFAQLSFIKTIYRKHIKRTWGQVYAYIWLLATTIEKTMNCKSSSARSYFLCVLYFDAMTECFCYVTCFTKVFFCYCFFLLNIILSFYNKHQVRFYHFFIVEIIVESVNLIQMLK